MGLTWTYVHAVGIVHKPIPSDQKYKGLLQRQMDWSWRRTGGHRYVTGPPAGASLATRAAHAAPCHLAHHPIIKNARGSAPAALPAWS